MKKTIFVLLIIFFCLAGATVANAAVWEKAQTVLKTGGDKAFGATPDLPVVIGNIINVALGIVGIVLVYILVNAGYHYMTASGEPGDVKKAKDRIVAGIVGLIIVFMAYAISNFIITRLVTAVTTGGTSE
jgi:hypothetical protein